MERKSTGFMKKREVVSTFFVKQLPQSCLIVKKVDSKRVKKDEQEEL